MSATVIGPYGAYLADGSEYTGKYDLSQTAFKDFHRRRMQNLLDAAGVFAVSLLKPNRNLRKFKRWLIYCKPSISTQHAWISFKSIMAVNFGMARRCQKCPTVNDVDQISAIGINCTTVENIADAVALIKVHR